MGVAIFPAAGGGVTQKVQEFTSTGTWTAPSNCSAIEVFLVGGGGGGGSCRAVGFDVRNSAGGGGGGTVRKALLPVTPGTTYTVTIGSGGAGGAGSGAAGSVGGDSSFGALLTALGGGSGGGKNESTYVHGTSRGTAGGYGTADVGSGNRPPAAPGGGAGGPATYHATSTQPFNANYSSELRTRASVQGSSSTMGVGGASFAPVTQTSEFTIIGGIGIDGYGAGGLGGYANTQTSLIISGYSGVPLSYPTTQGSKADGGSGQANSGNGGNGGSVCADGNSLVANGGAGGSGYCRITYWS